MQPVAFRFEDPMFEKDYGLFTAYANSKLALLMFAEELQHRLDREKSSVIVNSANPGELACARFAPSLWGTRSCWVGKVRFRAPARSSTGRPSAPCSIRNRGASVRVGLLLLG